ncbi:hypothetical protein [Nonomuraea sp. NPDC048826]|uniref:hypothetical protein n=1 Tax=Nonomuraea sp. NPDC048826 TaxID=3364347 RepID=UPI003715203C
MFADGPQLVLKILRDLLGVDLPDTPLIRRENASFNTRNSEDIASDLVFTLGPPQNIAHAVIVEIQQDQSKNPQQLARYAAALWLQLRCDVTVLVICPDRGTAAFYAKPIKTGLKGCCFRPHVLGPDNVPFITDPQEVAADPGMAALSLMVHGRERKVVEAFAQGMSATSDDHATQYTEYAYSMAAPEIRRLMEEIMTSTDWPVYTPWAREHYGRGLQEGKAEGKVEGKAEGKVEGKVEGKAEEAARSVLLVLEARGLEVPDDARARISSCTDLARLEAWVVRAATAQTLQGMFDD